MSVDFLGEDGGSLAMAFAAGCAATFTFCTSIGAFIWKFAGNVRKDRVTELEEALKAESARCAEMERRLVDRVQQLESVLLFEVAGNVRQNAALAIAELRQMMEKRITDIGGAAHEISDPDQNSIS